MIQTPEQWAIPSGGHTHVVRIHADAKGNSQLEELVISTKPDERGRSSRVVPVQKMFVREYKPNAYNDWHTTRARQFAITIMGELEVEVAGGVRRRIRTGELVFLARLPGRQLPESTPFHKTSLPPGQLPLG